MTIRIGILGLTGTVSRQVLDDAHKAGLTLVGGTVRAGSAKPVPQGVPVLPGVAELAALADVVVDFTHADAVLSHAAGLEGSACAWVLGTSGLSDAAQAAVAASARRRVVVRAANFSPGMNLVLALAERLGAALPGETYDAEIVDVFHRRKVDSPSGTALAIGRAVARGRGQSLEGRMEVGREGHTGARKAGAVGFSSLRGGAVVGEHTLMLTSASEQTTLAHRVTHPRIYAKGALRAALWTQNRAPGLYGMLDVVGEA